MHFGHMREISFDDFLSYFTLPPVGHSACTWKKELNFENHKKVNEKSNWTWQIMQSKFLVLMHLKLTQLQSKMCNDEKSRGFSDWILKSGHQDCPKFRKIHEHSISFTLIYAISRNHLDPVQTSSDQFFTFKYCVEVMNHVNDFDWPWKPFSNLNPNLQNLALSPFPLDGKIINIALPYSKFWKWQHFLCCF